MYSSTLRARKSDYNLRRLPKLIIKKTSPKKSGEFLKKTSTRLSEKRKEKIREFKKISLAENEEKYGLFLTDRWKASLKIYMDDPAVTLADIDRWIRTKTHAWIIEKPQRPATRQVQAQKPENDPKPIVIRVGEQNDHIHIPVPSTRECYKPKTSTPNKYDTLENNPLEFSVSTVAYLSNRLSGISLNTSSDLINPIKSKEHSIINIGDSTISHEVTASNGEDEEKEEEEASKSDSDLLELVSELSVSIRVRRGMRGSLSIQRCRSRDSTFSSSYEPTSTSSSSGHGSSNVSSSDQSRPVLELMVPISHDSGNSEEEFVSAPSSPQVSPPLPKSSQTQSHSQEYTEDDKEYYEREEILDKALIEIKEMIMKPKSNGKLNPRALRLMSILKDFIKYADLNSGVEIDPEELIDKISK